MLPDSTQNVDKPRTKKTTKKKQQYGGKFESGNRKSAMGRGRFHEQELRPLTQFVDDPRALIDQAFLAIGEEGLRAMIPAILQPESLSDLKSLIMNQLIGMDREEVINILKEPEELMTQDQLAYLPPDSTSLDQGEQSSGPVTGGGGGGGGGGVPESSDALDLFPESEDVEMLLSEVPASLVEAERSEDLASNLTKMQMEILELELRARAIKALLRSQRPGEDDGGAEQDGIPSEIV